MPDVRGLLPITSPLRGTVLRIEVAEGTEVRSGTALVVIESMKMEHVVEAPAAGTVVQVHARPGDTVDEEQVLIDLRGGGDDSPAGPDPAGHLELDLSLIHI